MKTKLKWRNPVTGKEGNIFNTTGILQYRKWKQSLTPEQLHHYTFFGMPMYAGKQRPEFKGIFTK